MEHTPVTNTSPANSGKRNLVLIGIVGLIGVLLALLALYGYLNQNVKKPTTASVKVLAAAEVTITATGFSPATIKIKKGQTVTWTNRDVKPHQVESDPYPTAETLPGLASAAPSEKGQSFSFKFEKSGTYTYHDRLNPLKLNGTVIVE